MTAELKTRENDGNVEEFLNSVENEKRRKDSLRLCSMMEEICGSPPRMWGGSIIGFGHVHYKYTSGREGDWFRVGFSPRKQNFSIYIMAGFDSYNELIGKLGKHRKGKSCLYINTLTDIDESVLRDLIRLSFEQIGEVHSV